MYILDLAGGDERTRRPLARRRENRAEKRMARPICQGSNTWLISPPAGEKAKTYA